jgi:hypothetical protein
VSAYHQRSCCACQRWTRRNHREGKCGLYDGIVTPPGERSEFGITRETDRCEYFVAEPDLFTPNDKDEARL